MSFAETVALGAIAGFTIFIGLPIGRVRRVDDRLRVGLAMFSVGILAFIFMDVTSHGKEIVERAPRRSRTTTRASAHVLGLFALLAVGFTAGTAGISAVERRLRPGAARPRRWRAAQRRAVGSVRARGATTPRPRPHAGARCRPGMTIAVAIGLHNFAEGLAIGVSAQAGEIALATVLIIGFGLHNATEGFGIVGPLGGAARPGRWLGARRPRRRRPDLPRHDRRLPGPLRRRSSCASTRSPAARSST